MIWTCYVLNRCPTNALRDVTPQEAWSGVKPSVKHFRVFGCLAHVHVPKEKRRKLDDRSVCCVLLGFSEGTKGYRLYNPLTEKIVVSRDVFFEEEKGWDWSEKHQEQILMDLEWEDQCAENNENADGSEERSENGAVVNVLGEAAGSEEIIATLESGENVTAGTTQNRVDGRVNGQNAVDQVKGRDSADNQHEGRVSRAPLWMRDYVDGEVLSEEEAYMAQVAAAEEDPLVYEEAEKEEKWRQAMDNEIMSIEKNKTWTLTVLPNDAKKIGVKWIYKTKFNENGEIEKHKARLVAKGYSQKHGVDYTEVFAPVARMDTVRMIISMAAQRGLRIGQLDVKSAFLHGELNEDVYVEQPRGYEKKGKEHLIYKLHKALYGLKQAPRAWFNRIETYFLKEGFQRCDSEQTLFTKKNAAGKIIIVSIYVDDLIFTGDDKNMMCDFKNSMMKEFDMTDLGSMRFFLGIEVLQQVDGIFIYQRNYALEILKRFGMLESNEVSSPIIPGFKINKDEHGTTIDETYFKQIMGSLMYLTATRPDMMFATSLISRFMSIPTELHLQAAKRVLRYLKGAINYGI